jgi:tetratricopeptide (TPR) repeat protein
MQSIIEARNKKPEAAAAALEEGIKANPKATTLYVARARLAEQQKQLDQAEVFLKKAEEITPEEPGLQDALARLYIMKNQWDKAEEALRRRMALEPDKEEPAAALARFYAARGKFEDGVKVLKDFSDKHPGNIQAKFSLANFYLAHRKFGPGERLLRDIAADDPTGPNGLKAKGELATLRLGRGQTEEADKLVQEILKSNPKDMLALKLQGLIALTKKDGLKAVSNFRILTQDQPQSHENWLLLARAHQINNEQELAKEAAKKALTLKPDYTEAQALLYGIYSQNKEYDALIKLIKDFLRSDDQNLANWGYLGDAYVFKGDEKEAGAAFQKMIALQPQNPAGYIKLALLARKNKQADQAAKHLEAPSNRTRTLIRPCACSSASIWKGNSPPRPWTRPGRRWPRPPRMPNFTRFWERFSWPKSSRRPRPQALAQALTLNINDPLALGLLVRAYGEMPDKPGALQQLAEKAADPQAPVFYALALAQLHERQQEGDKAIAIYNQLLERRVAPIVVKNNLAYLMAEHRPTPENLARAKELLTPILDDNPEDPRLLDTMGWIFCASRMSSPRPNLSGTGGGKGPGTPGAAIPSGVLPGQTGRERVRPDRAGKIPGRQGEFPPKGGSPQTVGQPPQGQLIRFSVFGKK